MATSNSATKPTGAEAGRGSHLLFALALVLVGLAVWWSSLDGPLHFDDILTIRVNPSIRSLTTALSPPPGVPTTGRPLVNLTFALNYALGGVETRGYHLVNLGLHLLAGLTLFGLMRRTLCMPPLAERFGGIGAVLAFAVALLWLLHPLQTGAVTYLTQRTEVLASLCYLLALYLFSRSEEGEGDRRAVWRSGAVAACFLAAASKEISASLPLALLLYDRCFVAGSFREALKRGKVFYPMLAASWLFQGALIYGAGSRSETVLSGGVLPPLDYALTEFTVVAKYLKLAFYPSPLVFDYGMPAASGFLEIAPAAALVLVLLGATLWALKENRPEGFCGALFFLVLAPTSSVFPIRDTIFEHRMYLPLAPVAAVAVCSVTWFWRSRAQKAGLWPLAALCAVVALALGAATVARNGVYRSSVTLWQDAAEKRPENPRAHVNLGNAWLDRGEPAKAEVEYLKTVALTPDDPAARENLGMARARQGKFDLAEKDFLKALELDPENLKTRYHYGRTLLALGQPEKGAAELKAVADDPEAPPEGLALVAEEFLKLGRPGEAYDFFARARGKALAAGDGNMAAQLAARLADLDMRLSHPAAKGTTR